MTMRCAFGKHALANQIGGQCAGSARANPAHANVFYFFISSFDPIPSAVTSTSAVVDRLNVGAEVVTR